MWILELTVEHVPKIVKICTFRNFTIVFSRGRGFIFQGCQHLQNAANFFEFIIDLGGKDWGRAVGKKY